MTRTRPARRPKTWLIWTSVGFFALSMPCAGFGVLGLLGIAADVSPDENRHIGLQSLRIAMVPAALGVASLLLLLALRRGAAPGD